MARILVGQYSSLLKFGISRRFPSFTASEPACHLDCEVSISWSQPAAVMRDVLALQILTIKSLFLDNTNPRTKVKMSSDKTVQ